MISSFIDTRIQGEMECLPKFGNFGILTSAESKIHSPVPARATSFLNVRGLPRVASGRISVFKTSLPVDELATQEALKMFNKERQLNGDFVSKLLDMLWRRDDMRFVASEVSTVGENSQHLEIVEGENDDGFLKLTKTYEWASGNKTAPTNKKVVLKEYENDSERRSRLNTLKYDALKGEMMLITIGVGTVCTGYCIIALSFQVAISYAAGVLSSCLYLWLLYRHVDNLSIEAVPQIFLKKKLKNTGMRSEDLKNLLEVSVMGSTMALSSPRLMIPVAIYAYWGLSHHLLNGFLHIELLPAMVGMFAYKAAALIQVYRDNEDLRFVFPESVEDSSNN